VKQQPLTEVTERTIMSIQSKFAGLIDAALPSAADGIIQTAKKPPFRVITFRYPTGKRSFRVRSRANLPNRCRGQIKPTKGGMPRINRHL
jgi:hypothetical protein